MKIFLATKNKDKITEFQEILSRTNVDLVTCRDIDIPDVLVMLNFNSLAFIVITTIYLLAS